MTGEGKNDTIQLKFTINQPLKTACQYKGDPGKAFVIMIRALSKLSVSTN